MKNLFGFLFVLIILYCLASLPAFLLYVFVGSYFYPLIGGAEHDTFVAFKLFFTVIAVVFAFWGYKKDLLNMISLHSGHLKSQGPIMK